MMGRRRTPGLKDTHRKILNFVEDFQEDNGYPPSIREIREGATLSSTSVVNYYLVQLEEMEYIERDQHVSRGIRLLKNAAGTILSEASQTLQNAIDELLQVPIMGRIAAGELMPVPGSDFSYMDAESVVNVSRSMLPAREQGNGLFALEVDGESMIDAMVNDGDIVIMKPANEARNGEMVAVWLDDRDETTLKYFYKEKDGRVRLQPANPTMKPIFIDNPSMVRIQGKVVMVVRRVENLAN